MTPLTRRLRGHWSRVRNPHKCCFTSYYYTDSCNIRYAPNRRISHLKFQNLIPPDPQGRRGRPPPALTPSTAFGRARRNPRFQSVPQNPKLPLHPCVQYKYEDHYFFTQLEYQAKNEKKRVYVTELSRQVYIMYATAREVYVPSSMLL